MPSSGVNADGWSGSGLIYRAITSLDDPIYDAWLDLYQQAFPLDEQMLVSYHNSALREKTGLQHVVAALDQVGKLAAMARFDLIPTVGVAALWYLAVRPEDRSKGIGSVYYQEIWRRIVEQGPAIKALFFEVEDPDAAKTPELKHEAKRRIEFYQRNGAQLVEGIHYEQSVEWQPPIPMKLMVHLREPMAAKDIVELAKALFGGDITVGHARRRI